MAAFAHGYPFDPSYGYSLWDLMKVEPPAPPADFENFWRARYDRALTVDPQPGLRRVGAHAGYEVYDLHYRSTGSATIGGWLLKPSGRPIRRGFVITHGYGGREAPDFDLPLTDAALMFPCFRGLARSRTAPISDNPAWHVLHDIHWRDGYVIGGCAEDIWLAFSALLSLFPETAGHLGYLGISLGGGIGALAMPWDSRVAKAHLNIPTFGHQPLRLQLPTIGSAASVQDYERRHGNASATLRYYDAATTARFFQIPVHIAAARFDPVVAPPGQFAIHNAIPDQRHLFVLDAGHFDYPGMPEQHAVLRDFVGRFFEDL